MLTRAMEAGLQQRGNRTLGSALVVALAALLAWRAARSRAPTPRNCRRGIRPPLLAAAAALAAAAFAARVARNRPAPARDPDRARGRGAVDGRVVRQPRRGPDRGRDSRGDARRPATRSSGCSGARRRSAETSPPRSPPVSRRIGTAVLLLGEAGWLGRGSLAALVWPRSSWCAAAVSRTLARLVRDAVRLPRGDAPARLEAAWLAFAVLVAARGVGGRSGAGRLVGRARLSPARGPRHRARGTGARAAGPPSPVVAVARPRRVPRPRVSSSATSESCPFCSTRPGSASSARRSRSRAASALAARRRSSCWLSTAFPTAMLQLKSAYVDWPAALLATAAAAQVAAPARDRGRMRVAGFLFGAAVATKVFALFAAPALLALAWRARPRPMRLAVRRPLRVALTLAPWLFWSERRGGSFLAPYADLAGELVARVARGHYFTRSPASGAARPEKPPGRARRRLRAASVGSRVSLQPIRSQRRRIQRDPGAARRGRTRRLERETVRAVSRRVSPVPDPVVASSTCRRSGSSSRSSRCTPSSRPEACAA